jgi:hypothetical protein
MLGVCVDFPKDNSALHKYLPGKGAKTLRAGHVPRY